MANLTSNVCLVTFAKKWEMEGKAGITVEYLATDTLQPFSNSLDGSKGFRHCKESVSTVLESKITEVPGWYQLDFVMMPNSKGKLEAKLGDLQLVKPINSK